MRFFPIENEELDKTENSNYIRDILYSWQNDMNLVTRFDMESGRIFHTFENQDKPDLFNGVLRVWTKKAVIQIIKKLNAKKQNIPMNIFEKFDMLEKVFNRQGKSLSEMNDMEKDAAYKNAIENARFSLAHTDYNMAAYFSKAALLYKNSPEAERILVKCRICAGFKNAA